MKMESRILNLQQGSESWLQHRQSHLNASDCSAAMGLSSYKTRSQLLHEKATGMTPEIDAQTQKRFDRGHDFEAIARPWAEELLDDSDLFPVVLAGEFEGLKLSASLDGLTMDRPGISFEHKSGNADLLASLERGIIPDEYHPQMEMGLMLSGAEKCLFMASSGDRNAMRWAWYLPNLELRAKIIATWHQFMADLAAYVPPEVATPVVAQSASNLPVVFDMRVEGRLVSCNIEQYKPAALAYIKDINTELITDQHFANADVDAKFCRSSADKLKLAIEQALGQMGDINTALNSVREIAAAFDAKGLLLEKLVKSEKEARKLAIVSEAGAALATHIKALEARMENGMMPLIVGDFVGVVKGLKSIDSMRDKANTELARCKIEANAIADKITANLKAIDEKEGFGFLFYDRKQLALKEAEFVAMAIKNRISDHQAKEAERIAAETARIAEQERIKAEAAAQARANAEIAAATAQARDVAQRQAAADAEAKRVSDEAIAKAQAEHPAVVAAVAQFDEDVRVMPTKEPAQARYIPHSATPPDLKLGQICARLGFQVTAEFLKSIGFESAGRERAAVLFHESDFDRICAALISHISAVRQGVAA